MITFHKSTIAKFAAQLGCIALLMETASVAQAQTDAWTRVAPQGMGFSVEMPGEPAHEITRHALSGGGEMLQHGFTFAEANNERAYLVSTMVAPTAAYHNNMLPKTTLNLVRDKFVGSLSGTVTRESSITIDGHPGRQIDFEGTINAVSYVGHMRSYLVGDRVFMVIVIGDSKKFHHHKLNRFWSSFELQ